MDKQKQKLKDMLEAEREKVRGYEQIAKVHSAYIAILLNKLGATEDKPITIKASEVTEALEKYEARAMVEPKESSWKLYCEVVK